MKNKHRKLKQVIKQKCKFLGNTLNHEEYRIRKIIADVNSQYLLHITNTTIERANEITLLEELKPLFVYLCSCILHEELHITRDRLHIKIQFNRTTLSSNDDIVFWTDRYYESPIRTIEKTHDCYMGFLKPFRLEIFLPLRGGMFIADNNNNDSYDSEDENENEVESDSEYDINVYREDECVICMENKANILFCDCGHLIVCDECYHELENDKCPKCRKVNVQVRKL